MALLDFLKKKDESKKAKKPEKKSEKISVQPEIKKTAQVLKPKEYSVSSNKRGFSYEAIKQPHISEKATYLAEKDQYVFKVLPNYNKNEIKNAVEGIYGVNVISVNIIKIPAKKRRLGRTEGFKKSYKKAVVKIKEGQKIEIL